MMATSFGKTSISGVALAGPAQPEKAKPAQPEAKAEPHAEGKKGKGKKNATEAPTKVKVAADATKNVQSQPAAGAAPLKPKEIPKSAASISEVFHANPKAAQDTSPAPTQSTVKDKAGKAPATGSVVPQSQPQKYQRVAKLLNDSEQAADAATPESPLAAAAPQLQSIGCLATPGRVYNVPPSPHVASDYVQHYNYRQQSHYRQSGFQTPPAPLGGYQANSFSQQSVSEKAQYVASSFQTTTAGTGQGARLGHENTTTTMTQNSTAEERKSRGIQFPIPQQQPQYTSKGQQVSLNSHQQQVTVNLNIVQTTNQYGCNSAPNQPPMST